jgi:hypothetical protein
MKGQASMTNKQPTEHKFEGKDLAFLERQFAQIERIQIGINGALTLLCDQKGLAGNWVCDWANRRMIRPDDPNAAMAAMQQQPAATPPALPADDVIEAIAPNGAAN